jgi:ubiquinone/menaquinone biosynthesis C-methylase UbiE
MNGGQQALVNSHFESAAQDWADVYECRDDVYALILQERLKVVLGFVDAAALPPHRTRVLEVGCGAGYATVALARKHYEVYALDTVDRMITSTRTRVRAANVSHRVHCGLADIRQLPFADDTFDLIVALGVLPWLPSPAQPVHELSRVVRPGGCLIASIDNRWSVRRFVDPLSNPLLRPLKEVTKNALRRFGKLKSKARPRRMAISGFDNLLQRAGLVPVDALTLGFGPLTCFGKAILPEQWGVRVHSVFQDWSYRGFPVVRFCGAEYVVRAKART